MLQENQGKITIEQILECLYLVVLALFVIYKFLGTTMWVITWPNGYLDTLTLVLLVVVLGRTMVTKSNAKEIVFCIVLAFVCLYAWKKNGYTDSYYMLLLILGCRGIPVNRIVKVYLGVSLIVFAITIGAALTGQIENLIYHQTGRHTRMALGIVYPTDFSAHVFYLTACYEFLRRKNLKWWDIGLPFVMGILVYVLCEARLNTICLVLLGCGLGCYSFWKQKGEPKLPGTSGFSILLSVSPLLCAVGMVLVSILYDSSRWSLAKLNRILNSRISLSKEGIVQYGIDLWGKYIPQIGSGNTTDNQVNYFFLDSSYIMILLCFGIMILLVILSIMSVLCYRSWKYKEWVVLWILAVISLQCVVEHHMTDAAYHPFLWLVLAEWGTKKEVAVNG